MDGTFVILASAEDWGILSGTCELRGLVASCFNDPCWIDVESVSADRPWVVVEEGNGISRSEEDGCA